MIGRWLSAVEIAEIMNISIRWSKKRAISEHWPSRNEKANGGTRRIYQVAALPEDIQTAYAESLKLGLTGLQSQLKPASKHEKKVIMANHSARSAYGAEAAPLEKAGAAKRRTASLRAKVLHAWDGSGLNAERFLFEYNEGRIAREARAEPGGKTLRQAALYVWLGKYRHHDGAGLTPKHEGRGGNGASLDERTARFGSGKDFASRWLTGNAWNEQHHKIGAAGRKAVSSVMDGLGRPPRFTEPYHGQSKHIERA
jgi:hypothetical protein